MKKRRICDEKMKRRKVDRWTDEQMEGDVGWGNQY